MAVEPDKKTTRSESQTKIDTLRAKVSELKSRIEELEAENSALKKITKNTGSVIASVAKPVTTPDTKQFFAKKRAIAEMDAAAKAKKGAAENNRRFKKNAADAKLAPPARKKSRPNPKAKFFDNSPGLQAKRDSRNAARVAAKPRAKK